MFDFDSDNEEEMLENLYTFLTHPDLEQDFKDCLKIEMAEKFLQVISDYQVSYIRVPTLFLSLVLDDLIIAKFLKVKRLHDFAFVKITPLGLEFLDQK